MNYVRDVPRGVLLVSIFPVDQSLWFVWMSVDNERYGSSRVRHITSAATFCEAVNISHCPNIPQSHIFGLIQTRLHQTSMIDLERQCQRLHHI